MLKWTVVRMSIWTALMMSHRVRHVLLRFPQSSPKNGAVPTPDSPPSGSCVQNPPELPPSIPQLPQTTAMGDSAHGVPSAWSPGVIAEDKNLPQPQVPTATPPLRRYTRVRKPPEYYGHS